MKQSRDPKGPGHPVPAPESDISDLVDLKAIAASMRAEATPRSPITASELSGVVGRRDSVVGARVERGGPLTGVPPWFWGVVGCLGVMALGLGVFWYLTGPVGSATASTSQAAKPPPPPAGAPAQGPEIVPMAPPSRLDRVDPVAEPTHAEKAAARRASGAVGNNKPARGEASAQGAEAVEPEGSAARPIKKSEVDSVLSRALDGESGDGTKDGTKDGAKKGAAARANSEAADNPVDRVDAALDELQPKVRECFHRFQIRGVAQVNLTVAPSGSVQSSALTGDFEGTPTGECVIKELASAALPPFKGDPVRVTHQYVFR